MKNRHSRKNEKRLKDYLKNGKSNKVKESTLDYSKRRMGKKIHKEGARRLYRGDKMHNICVNIEQIKKVQEIARLQGKFDKEIYAEAFADLIKKYQPRHSEEYLLNNIKKNSRAIPSDLIITDKGGNVIGKGSKKRHSD